MPIYEYLCMKCESRLEAVQRHNDEPLKVCPECGGNLKKLISSTSFVLKGTGWYKTDYAHADKKKAVESDSKPSEEKKKEEKKEQKTETATA